MAITSESGLFALDTPARLEKFTELVAIAIAKAETRAELTASRARIVAAADDARRRIERDLHDRAQQPLVSLGLELGSPRRACRSSCRTSTHDSGTSRTRSTA